MDMSSIFYSSESLVNHGEELLDAYLPDPNNPDQNPYGQLQSGSINEGGLNFNQPSQENPNELLQENTTTQASSNHTMNNSSPSSRTPREKNDNRKDKIVKGLSQNISSFLKTTIPKILASGVHQKTLRKEIKNDFTEFLKRHKASNNQMVIAFAYWFLIYNNVSEGKFLQLRNQLKDYFKKRSDDSIKFEPQQRELWMQKINVNIRIVTTYFDGNRLEMDFDELKKMCQPLFGGRQKAAINRPLANLKEIQKQFLGNQTQLLPESKPSLITSSESPRVDEPSSSEHSLELIEPSLRQTELIVRPSKPKDYQLFIQENSSFAANPDSDYFLGE